MLFRLYNKGRSTEGVHMCYDLDTLQGVCLDAPTLEIAQEFQYMVNFFQFGYNYGGGYLILDYLDEGAPQIKSVSAIDPAICVERDLATLNTDLLVRILSVVNVSYRKLNRNWNKHIKTIEEITEGKVRLPHLKDVPNLSKPIPTSCILTRAELKEYENVFGRYVLVNNICTCVTLEHNMHSKNKYNNVEIEKGNIEIKGGTIIFDKHNTLPIYEILPYANLTIVPELAPYVTAYQLANAYTQKLSYHKETLHVGDIKRNIPYNFYTYFHKSAFIQVTYLGQYGLYSAEGDLNTTALQLPQCTFNEVSLWDVTKGSYDQLKNYCMRASFYTNLDGVDLIYFIGVTQVALLEKGYDIRVLGLIENKGVKQYIEVPLLCSGLPVEKEGQGYVYHLGMQDMVLSKTVYENLVCVGNGTQIYQP